MIHSSPTWFGFASRVARHGAMSMLLMIAAVPWATAQPAPDSLSGPPVPPVVTAPDSTTAPEDFAIPALASEAVADTGEGAAGTRGAAVHHGPLPLIRKVRLEGSDHNIVRSGPGNGFALVGVYKKGLSFAVIAKSGDWYNVRLSETDTGWIHASLVKEFDDLADLEFKPNPRLYTRTGAIVLGGYAGAYAFDRKSNSLVAGGRVSYYVFDRLQFEGGVAWTHVRRPAEIVESLFGLSLEAEDFHMLFYQMNATWELLPGRQMVPFLSLGFGAAIMQGESEPSFNFGAGTVLFLSKRTAMRWEVRDYRLHSGSDAARVSNDNVEFTLGTQYVF